MKKMNLGIKPKLVVAFGLVLGTTLLASGIALYTYSRVSSSLSDITNNSVPFMADSMELTQLGLEISARTPLLSTARSASEAQLHYESLTSASAEIERLLASTTGSGIAEAGIQSSSNLDDVLKVRGYLSEIEDSVDQRLQAEKSVYDAAAAAHRLLFGVNQQLLDAIDSATFDFVIMAEDIFSENSELIDSLLNQHVEIMVNSLSLQNSVSELVSILSQVAEQTDEEQNFDSQLRALVLLDTITQNKRTMDGLKIAYSAEVDAALQRLDELTRGEENIFDIEVASGLLQKQDRAIFSELKSLEVTVSNALTSVVHSSYQMVFQTGQELSESVKVTLPSFMNEALENLVNLLQLRAELNTLGGILAQITQVSEVVELQPLKERYLASREAIRATNAGLKSTPEIELMQGQINGIITLGDPDRGLFKFKAAELSQRERIVSIEETLGQTQTDFVNRLAEQVNASRIGVDEAGQNVMSLISSSRIQLILISLLSIGLILLVFWLLISRNILARLLQTIKALRSLADGDYDVSVDSNGTDELSDLAQTVEVFRSNALKAQRLQEEQEKIAGQQKAQEEAQAERDRLQREEEVRRHELEQADAARHREQATILQQRVDSLLAAVSAAAEGNLNHPIDTQGDDLAGQMGRALDSLFSELRASMVGINENATQLARASEGLTSLSEDMSSLAASNSESAQEASVLTNDVGSSVDSVAGATEQMSSSIREIARNTTEAETVAEEAVKLARSTDATVRKLADSSAGIGSVIKVITSIAEQTNLLALNATIEAARAGDAGKGFAVVANEVKELAKETARATEQIESRISDIQTDTDSAVQAIESIGNIIGKISAIQSAIAIAIDEQSSVTQEISRSIVHTADGSEAISSLIENVAEKAKMNQQASDEVSTAAVELSDMAGQLQKLVVRFASGTA